MRYQFFQKKNLKNQNHFFFLADIFYDKRIYYTYEEYLEHINLTKKYEKRE